MPLESREESTSGRAKPLGEDFAHTDAAIHRTSEAESDSVEWGATNVNPNGTADTNGPAKPLEEYFAHTGAAIYRTSEVGSASVDRGATNVNPNGTADHAAEAAAQLQEAAIHRTSEADSVSVHRGATNVKPNETADQGEFEGLAAEAAAQLQEAADHGEFERLVAEAAAQLPEAAIHRTSEAESDSVDLGAANVNPNGTADQREFERLVAEAAAPPQEAAIHRTSEAESDCRDATNVSPNGTGDQGEFERLVAEVAAQLQKAAQRDSVPGRATAGDGIWPLHSLKPDYPTRPDALRGLRTTMKMSFLTVGILSMPMAYYFLTGAWDPVPGASPPELASFNSKPIISPAKSSTEEETGERAALRGAQTAIPAPAAANPPATTGRTAVEAQTPIPAPRPTATTDRTTVEAQTPSPHPAAASPTATTSRTAVAPASEQNVTASDQRNADEIVVLLKRGQELMHHGDLTAARLVLRHAAEAKNAEAALTLGSTYDPITLRELRVYGFSADVGMARTWYEKAKELGSPEAARRLDNLAR